MNNKADILDRLARVSRPGMDSLMAWLESTDFFTAPASANNHSAFEGGLAYHSLQVHEALVKSRLFQDSNIPNDSGTICALLHDAAKIGRYRVEMRNTKDAKGNWVKVPFYAHNNGVTMDHGVQSCLLIQKHIKLTDEEFMAIRWHHGAYTPGVVSDYETGKCYSAALRHPLVMVLHHADMEAAHLVEEVKQ